jgi:hypothetical protein
MMPVMPVTGGPYLGAAIFCEKVLRETDGVLSLIRVVDRWTVNGVAEVMPLTVIQTTLVIMLKSGIHRGSSQITLTPTSPSGKLMQAVTLPTIFEGDDDRGVAAIANIGFPVQEDGVYWFDLEVDGQQMTKLPLRVAYLRSAPMPNLPPNLSSGPQNPPSD